MTIMNIRLERDRAIVSANTEIQMPEGTTAYADKIFPLPHINCLVVGRGEVNVLLNTYLHSFTTLKDFDGLAAIWDVFLSHLVTEVYGKPRGDVKPHGAEIVLVGWSKVRQEMVCLCAKIEDDGAMELHDVKGGMLTPWDGSWGPTPDVAMTAEAHIAHARHQSGLGERFYPGKCWRGDLTIADLRIDSLHVSVVREFWKA